MPQNESFWNPYRWVPASSSAICYETPLYRHCWRDLSGYLLCSLQTLTPLIIGSGRNPGQFISSTRSSRPFIPGTSLKGLIRSLIELIGNAASPFPHSQVDSAHQLPYAARCQGSEWQLDIASRMFGYLSRGQVFAGLVRFSDAELQGNPQFLGPFQVAGGTPKPDHRPFYPSNTLRKFYHHHVDTHELTPPHAGIRRDQQRTVRPLAPGMEFRFRVDFENLRDNELDLLLYCLILEDNVTVSLSPQAAGTNNKSPVTFTGPMRHKLGGCKPQGAGSVEIKVMKMVLWPDRRDRYRGVAQNATVLEGDALKHALRTRTHGIASRTDPTMMALRAMLIYSSGDPRKDINYPTYQWFQNNSTTPLKPTL